MTASKTTALWIFFLFVLPVAAQSERFRVATFNVELHRDGPGLMLRDIEQGRSPQVDAVVQVISEAAPDILAIQGFDWDYDGAALAAFIARLKANGVLLSYSFSQQPNSGIPTHLDLDGDKRLGEPEDAQGYGAFTGNGGMAVLSRFPILTDQARNLSDLIWSDLPWANLPVHTDGTPFPSEDAQEILRLSSTGHWIVPVELPGGKTVSIMTFHATPPVFDGPEDRNGKRNHDEIRLWSHVLQGDFGQHSQDFIIAGDANLDPHDSEGQTHAIRALLANPRVVDPWPDSPGAAALPDQGHVTPNSQDTVDWEEIGRFRVDYVLPSSDFTVLDSGVFWPGPQDPRHQTVLTASRHRLVWVDLMLDER